MPLSRELLAESLRQSLAHYYRAIVPTQVCGDDYQLWACRRCTLEFAWPMAAGDAAFYDWITHLPNYYPADRWEWGEVRRRLAAQARPLHLLEVGCGSGDFLSSLNGIRDLTFVGLDTTEGSVAACHAKGLEVHAETLAEFEHRSPQPLQKPDVIVAFHCLEHVADPRAFIAGMCRLIAPGGRIFVSTPYSPMSFEGLWFDPLNHPPHHMTRWNRRAYTELASQLALEPTFTMPPAASIIDRVAETFNLTLNGPQRMQSRRTILLRAARRPWHLSQEVVRQVFRERMAGATAANVILAELARSSQSGRILA